MTVIAYRNGVIAADSRVTIDTEAGGIRMALCDKLFRKRVTLNGVEQEVIIATAGEGFPGLVFVDWFGSGKEAPELFVHGEADFSCLVLSQDGLFEYDKWCRGEKIKNEFYAIGCGAKVALGAMDMGSSAIRACYAAIRHDPLCGPPVVTMRLKNGSSKKTRRSSVPPVRKANDERPEVAVWKG